jgi:excinuclease ABC subunit A
VEHALKLGEGVMIVQIQQQGRSEDILFSEHLACLQCGISIPDIEPRTFSFNSPHGACPACTGLGKKLEVDVNLVVPNPKLTIGEGAIRPWYSASHRVGRQGWFWSLLEDVSKHYDFSLDIPWNDLSSKAKQVLLFGDRTFVSGADFEGVVPFLERRWKETESEWSRAEIEKYMTVKICPVCQGRRLKSEALSVKVAGNNIAQVSSLTISALRVFFASFTGKSDFSANHKKIAQPIIKEILSRLQFLIDVGLEYLTLDRESETLAPSAPSPSRGYRRWRSAPRRLPPAL